MTKVYVTQETNHDFTKAEQYGEVVFLTRDDLNNIKSSLQNDKVLADIKTKLRGFNPDEDWLVITGSPYISAAVFLILGHLKVYAPKILRWDNRDFRYVPMQIELRRERKDHE